MRTPSLLIVVAALMVSGCGGPQMAPVKGRVTFDGQPVKEAQITFSPMDVEGQKETGKPGTGFTDDEGNFDISTFKNYDGALVGTNPNTAAQVYNGFWRAGSDNLSGWPLQPSSNNFNGTIDEIAVYSTALSASQVADHFSNAQG